MLFVLGARRRMIGEQQLGNSLDSRSDARTRGGRLHLHAFFDGPIAGGGQDAPADIHYARSADGDRIIVLAMAQDGDVDAGLRGDIVNGGGKDVVSLGDVVVKRL